MTQFCTLRKDSSDPRGYAREDIEELEALVCEGRDAAIAEYGDNIPMLRQSLRNLLYLVGDTYTLSQLNIVSKITQECLEEIDGLMDLIPQAGVKNTIDRRTRAAIKDVPQYNMINDGEVEEISKIKSRFFDQAFGNLAKIKNEVKQLVSRQLLDTFIVNREEGILVQNITDLNNNAKVQKNKLYQTVLKYLNYKYSIQPDNLFENGEYTHIDEQYKLQLNALQTLFNPQDIERLYYDKSPEAKLEYDAVIAYFTLKNFDNFVEMLLGTFVNVDFQNKNQLTNKNIYSYSEKGKHVIDTWRTSDNINIMDEIGALSQMLVNTTPYYTFKSNTKSNKFIKFEDFARIVTTIKDLVYDKESSKYIFSTSDQRFDKFFDSLDEDEAELVRNKSLRYVINSLRRDSNKYSKIIFKALNECEFLMENFTEDEKAKCWSIYKGLFDRSNSESLLAVQSKYPNSTNDYYSMLTQVVDTMFSVSYVQYFQQDNGTIQIRSLRDQNEDIERRNIENTIINNNTRRNSFKFEESVDRWKAKPIKDSANNLIGFEYSIPTNNGTLVVKINDMGENISYSINGKYVEAPSLEEMNDFLADQLGIDFNLDTDYLEAVKLIFKGAESADLIHLASSVFFNRYISNVELQNIKGPKATNEKLEQIYKGHDKMRPRFNYKFNEVNLAPDYFLNTLNRMAQAKTITSGAAQSFIVSDANGNMLNTQVLSRLLGSIGFQYENIRSNASSAANHFSILKPGFLKGFHTIKEVKLNSGNKERTAFTVAESIQASFLYEFVNGFINYEHGKHLIGNGVIGVLPSVNSDKSTISTALFDLNEISKFGVPYKQLTNDQLIEVIEEELGKYYENQINEIQSTLSKLNIIIPEVNIGIDFRELNDYCEKLGVKTLDFINERLSIYNNAHPLEPIELVEQVHYIKNGKFIKRNNTIKVLYDRYHNPKRHKLFVKRKEADLLKALLDESICINLYDESTGVGPKDYLKTEQFKDWVGKKEYNNGKMTLAKIRLNGKTYYITDKIDIFKLAEENNIDFDQLNKNLYSLDIELHPMLTQYNLYDYFLTQEFLLSSVGSHIAHKTKTSSPIIRVTSTITSQLTEDFFDADAYTYEARQQLDPNSWDYNMKLSELYKQAYEEAIKRDQIMVTSSNAIKTTVVFDKSLDELLQREEPILDSLVDFQIKEEAGRFLAQHKRNVSLTAAMHPFQLASINGIPSEYNMAVIEDIIADIATIHGLDEWPPLDGATFVHPLVVYWENNSLQESKAGVDKKQFWHYYNEKLGTGGIIKTAGFGLTNDRIKNYKFYRVMVENMMKHSWRNPDGQLHVHTGIFKDYNGNDIHYNPYYLKREGKYYMRELINFENGIYNINETEVDEYGEVIGDTKPIQVSDINSNYALWQMFGGYNSLELNDNGILEPSEYSLKIVADIANKYGYKKLGVTEVKSASDIVQPMKLVDILYMPTVGAIKQGAANINKNNFFYKPGMINHMRVKVTQAGIQLDKEHHADQSLLSLMTQVISAAAANGYTLNKSSDLYKSLKILTDIGTKEFRDSLGNITTDKERFDAAISHIILDTILNSQVSDGDLIQTIASNLIREFRNNKQIKLTNEFKQKVDESIPYSNRGVFKKLVSNLTSTLTKKSIKQKVPGTLSVLNPSHDAIKLYKIPMLDENYQPVRDSEGNIVYKKLRYGDLENYFKVFGVNTEEEVLQQAQQYIEPTEMADVEVGHYYDLYDVNGNFVNTFLIGNPSETHDQEIVNGAAKIGYVNLKSMTQQGEVLRENIQHGEDLQNYNVRFTANGQRFQMWDLDVVQDYFKIKSIKNTQECYEYCRNLLDKYGLTEAFKNYINKEVGNNPDMSAYLSQFMNSGEFVGNSLFKQFILNKAQRFIHRKMQETLNSISPSNPSSTVIIGGQELTIDKNSIKTQAYGCIMPKTFKSNLGLETYDNLEDIKHNPDFFMERLARKLTTKVDNYSIWIEEGDEVRINNFDLELKRGNGNHVYIKSGLKDTQFATKVNISTITNDQGRVFRVNEDGIMYEMYSENDEVYLDNDGNEIIVTQDGEEWQDSKGNIISVRQEGEQFFTSNGHEIISDDHGNYIDTTLEESVTRIINSGTQFYLNSFDYDLFYINDEVNDIKFQYILDKALKCDNSKKLAQLIKNSGRDSKSLRQAINKQRELVKQLREFRVEDNLEELKLTNPVKYATSRVLYNLGRKMHTSFLKSLDIIAARIPAQSQQSFMAMEVVGYENPDINSAYVSTLQFYLQGSDLDIDAVSLQTYALSKSGIYAGHSPYYSLQSKALQKASEKLPFPTNKELTIEYDLENSTLNKYFDLFQDDTKTDAETDFLSKLIQSDIDQLSEGLLKVFIDKNGEPHLSLSTKTIQDIYNLSNILSESTFIKLSSYEDFKQKYKETYGLELTNEQIEKIEDQLIDIINKHNLYLLNSSDSKRKEIAQNYAMQQEYDIIVDPINQMQAQSSVDTVTATAKNLAATSSKATLQETFTEGNFANKHQSITGNMTGKDGIAICATGLKGFFALTQLYNQRLTYGQTDNTELLCEVHIGGKTYRGLANVFTPKFLYENYELNINNPEFVKEIQDYLYEQVLNSDMVNEFSALLSLSADNAKELVLDKINAGTDTMGLYLFGLSLGVPFRTLYNVLSSPLATRVSELIKGDMFNDNQGSRDVVGALDYLMKNPDLSKYEYNELSNIPSVTELFGINNLRDWVVDRLYQAHGEVYLVQGELESLRKSRLASIPASITNSEEFKNIYQIKFNQLVDFAIQFVSDVKLSESTSYNTVYGQGNYITDLETLALGALEMKELGRICRLNQGLRTNPYDVIKQVAVIEELTVKRLKQITRYQKRWNNNQLLPEVLPTKDLTSMLENPNDYRIDFSRFITDNEYAERVIKEYDSIKVAYNPLRILKEVEHYKGYAETLYFAHEGFKSKSLKYKLLSEESVAFCRRYNIFDQKLQDEVNRNYENMLDSFFRDKWLQDRYKSKRIKLPVGAQAFVGSTVHPTPVLYERPIQLGTTLGNANFKLLVETKILPELQKRYPNNKFLRDLKLMVIPRTQAGTISTALSLPINMMPRTDYERDAFNEYKQSFNDIIKEDRPIYNIGIDISIQELLYLYSLISNNGTISHSSLHSIFENYLNSEPAQDFHRFISKIDQSQDTDILQGYYNESVDILPFSSPFIGGSDKFKQFDRETETIRYWTKFTPDPSQPTDEASVNGYISSEGIAYNPNFFTRGIRYSDSITTRTSQFGHIQEGISQLSEPEYSAISKYNITIEKTKKGIGLVNVTARNSENAENAKKFMKLIGEYNKGMLYTKLNEQMEEVLDLDRINNELERIECLNV